MTMAETSHNPNHVVSTAIITLFYNMQHSKFLYVMFRMIGNIDQNITDLENSLLTDANTFIKQLQIINPALDIDIEELIIDFIDKYGTAHI